ncbi:hypothetical protein ACMXYX_07270 [Neptuniibacter sp. QD72_48]|uniref:hypothetical protein n=1 Tax=Neptuniibacter sp. QD72_48 TaxID=3398214 RepID=UPI0039F512FC
MEEIIGIFASIVGVIGGLYQGYRWLRKKLDSKKAEVTNADSFNESVAERFINLFEAHGVYRNQIPEFFDHGFTIEDVQTEDNLLAKLTPSLLQSAADLFQVNAEWLSHGQGDIFKSHHFYKHPAEFGCYIDKLQASGDEKQIEGFVLTVKPPRKHEEDTLIVLKESVGRIGDRTIFRYHLCPDWILSYWKCCADVACCIAQAQMRDVFLVGKYVEKEWLQSFADGMSLPKFSFDLDEIDMPIKGWWQTDEFVDIPDRFIEPLSKEDGFSVRSAIGRWLKYYEDGEIYVFSVDTTKRMGSSFREYMKGWP